MLGLGSISELVTVWIQCYFYRYVVLRRSLWCQFSQRYSLFVLPQNGKYCSTEPGANFNMILTRYSCPFYDSNTGWEFCIYSIWRINPKSVSFSTFIFHMNYFFWTSWFLNVIYIPTSKKSYYYSRLLVLDEDIGHYYC